MEKINLEKIKKDMIKIVNKCSKILKKVYLKKNVKTTFKDKEKNDFLTYYDTFINEKIYDFLEKKYPDFEIYSEEKKPKKVKNQKYSFCFDPIDGTRNFVKKISNFFCGISFCKNYEPLICVSKNPITNELFSSIKNKGSYKNKEKIQVSKNKNIENLDIGICIHDKNSKKLARKILLTKIYKIINNGSAHKDYCDLSCGKMDGCIFTSTKAHDNCLYSMVKEANGIITDFKGKKPTIFSKGLIGANSKEVHKFLLSITKRI